MRRRPGLPSRAFGPFGGRVWLNAAHQGPLPRTARRAALRALREKTAPHQLRDARFREVPARLRRTLARLIAAPPREVILGNSASYGLHLIANGHPWRPGDRVLVAEGDFPATQLPWLGLTTRGVTVGRIARPGPVPTPEDVAAALTPTTRVLCLSWVDSYHGHVVDCQGIGAVCRDRDVRFVLNATQGLGCLTFDVRTAGVDALVSSGFKWLCGPYGTGFCWIRDEWRQQLEVRQSYWLALHADRGDGAQLTLRRPAGLPAVPGLTGRPVRDCDVFGTANFLNFMPWTAALEALLAVGVRAIEGYVALLVDTLLHALTDTPYRVLSAAPAGRRRSAIVAVSHADPARNPAIHQGLVHAGFDGALRDGNIRLSPHLYNTVEQMERVSDCLRRLGRAAGARP